MNRNKTNPVTKKSHELHNQFYCELLPEDLLLGMNFRNFQLIEQDENGVEFMSPTLKIELGFLFIKFSFLKVTYQG